VFGPNQYPEKLIPRFIKQLKGGEPVTIQGNGQNIRDFLYVDDVVSAFLIIHEKGEIGEIYNIGCDDNMGLTVLDVAHRLIEIIKGSTDYQKFITYVEDRPYNDFRYTISNERLKALGWTIRIPFEEGLLKLI
jgi:dTDP-D-glucose 4,6-dehydratase